MLLTIDIGNTMTDFGFFGEDEPLYYRIKSNKNASLEETEASFSLFLQSKGIAKKDVRDAIIGSVVPSLTPVYQQIVKHLFGIEAKLFGPKMKTGVKIVTDNPKEVGADMIAVAVAVKAKYGDSVLVADLGTANKVFLISKEGAFAGCTIGAGIGLQERSLSSSASLLPEVSLQIPPQILGKNTIDCMNSALTYGNAFATRALADAIEKEVGYPCKRVLTGGYASYIKDLLPEFVYEPYLVLDGLAETYRKNNHD